MEERMKEPHEKGVAIRSAPSFALDVAKCPAKRKQGKRWAGYRASKIGNQGADAVQVAANQDYSLNSATNPAKSGSYLIVYITGQGAFRTAVPSGAAAPSSPLALTAAATTATIGG